MEGEEIGIGHSSGTRIPRNWEMRDVLLGALVVLVAFAAYFVLSPKWEYRSVKCVPEKVNDRTDQGAFAYATIGLNQAMLDKMGDAGWELVSSSLEMETAFPNFGKADYVLGIQANVRPQALILVFKRRVLPWRE